MCFSPHQYLKLNIAGTAQGHNRDKRYPNMPHLLKAPNEILNTIMADFALGDLEAFSMVKKYLRIITMPALCKSWRSMSQKYGVLSFGHLAGEKEGNPHPAFFLKDLLEEKLIAKFPRQIRIGDCGYAEQFLGDRQSPIDDEIMSIIEENKDRISDMCDKCVYLEPGETRDWWERITWQGSEECLTALLLLQLPQVRGITISVNELRRYALDINMFRYIVTRAASAEQDGLPPPHPFSRLKNFEISVGGVSADSFDMCVSFARLPLIDHISGMSIMSDRIRRPELFQISAITTLEFTKSCIHYEALGYLIGMTCHLRKFVYSYIYRGYRFDPHYVVDALRRWTSKSLKTLKLLSDPREYLERGDGRRDKASTLQGF